MDKIDPDRTVKSWDELVSLEKEFSNVRNPKEWVFRGEAKHQEPRTSLQRVCEQFAITDLEIPRLESLLLYEFKRNYPVFARSVEVEFDDTLYWISLMRHYGAPTRFLDFTYSFFIASFFALERPAESGRGKNGNPEYHPAAVWAINKGWLTEHMRRLMMEIDCGKTMLCKLWENREGEAFKRIFWEQNPPRELSLQ
jgi:hypothetical protein